MHHACLPIPLLDYGATPSSDPDPGRRSLKQWTASFQPRPVGVQELFNSTKRDSAPGIERFRAWKRERDKSV